MTAASIMSLHGVINACQLYENLETDRNADRQRNSGAAFSRASRVEIRVITK